MESRPPNGPAFFPRTSRPGKCSDRLIPPAPRKRPCRIAQSCRPNPPRAITATSPPSSPKPAPASPPAIKSWFPPPAPANSNASPTFATNSSCPIAWANSKQNATVTRLAQEESSAPGAGIVLTKAPLAEGVVFVDAKVVLYGNADLFETLPAPSQRARSRPKTSSFFSDFSDLKPGDYVVHVDHGIGQFEGLRQVAIEGANGEFMLLKFAGDAKLYVPLARIDLDSEIHFARRRRTPTRPPGHHRLGSPQIARQKIRQRHGRSASRTLRRAKTRRRPHFSAGYQFHPRIRRRLRIRRNHRPAARHRRRQTRHGIQSAHGPPALRRRGLRQNRSRHARRLQSHRRFQTGRHPRPYHCA